MTMTKKLLSLLFCLITPVASSETTSDEGYNNDKTEYHITGRGRRGNTVVSLPLSCDDLLNYRRRLPQDLVVNSCLELAKVEQNVRHLKELGEILLEKSSEHQDLALKVLANCAIDIKLDLLNRVELALLISDKAEGSEYEKLAWSSIGQHSKIQQFLEKGPLKIEGKTTEMKIIHDKKEFSNFSENKNEKSIISEETKKEEINFFVNKEISNEKTNIFNEGFILSDKEKKIILEKVTEENGAPKVRVLSMSSGPNGWIQIAKDSNTTYEQINKELHPYRQALNPNYELKKEVVQNSILPKTPEVSKEEKALALVQNPKLELGTRVDALNQLKETKYYVEGVLSLVMDKSKGGPRIKKPLVLLDLVEKLKNIDKERFFEGLFSLTEDDIKIQHVLTAIDLLVTQAPSYHKKLITVSLKLLKDEMLSESYEFSNMVKSLSKIRETVENSNDTEFEEAYSIISDWQLKNKDYGISDTIRALSLINESKAEELRKLWTY
jgi:hypothetical protein